MNYWTKLIDQSSIPQDIFSLDVFIHPFNYDKTANIIYYVVAGLHKLYKIDLNNNTIGLIPVNSWPFSASQNFVFDPVNNRIIAWRAGTDNVYAISVTGGDSLLIGNGAYDDNNYFSQCNWNPISNNVGFLEGMEVGQ